MFRFNRDVEAKEAAPGILRKALNHSDQMMLCEFTLDKGAVIPNHTHPHEQMSYVVSGRFRYTIGDETREVGPGDTALVPSDVPHKVEVLEDTKAIDIFLPVREDYL